MKLKPLIVSVSALAVLSIIVFVVRRPEAPASADARVGAPVVEAALIEQATKLRIVDQANTVTLTRGADDSWRVEEYHGLRADFSKLAQLVSSVAEAKITRFVSARSEILSRLDFGERRIEFFTTNDRSLAMLVLGKNADTGGRYVKFGDESRAYLANLNVWLDAVPKNWADSRLLSLKPEDVAHIEISLPNEKPLTFSREKAGDPWTTAELPENRSIVETKISALVSSLVHLRFSETTAPDDEAAVAARAHTRSFRLTTFGGAAYTVALGRKPEEKKLKTPEPGSADFLKNSPVNPDGSVKPIEPKPELPEFETIPAGPVYVFITAADEKEPVNEAMRQRAYQVSEYSFTSLPHSTSEFFEEKEKPAASAETSEAPAGES